MTEKIERFSDHMFQAGRLAAKVVYDLLKILALAESRKRIKIGWRDSSSKIAEANTLLEAIDTRLRIALPMAENVHVQTIIKKALEYNQSAIANMKATTNVFKEEYFNISDRLNDLINDLKMTIKSCVATFYAITAAFIASGKFIPPGYPPSPFPETLDFTGAEYITDIVQDLTIPEIKEVELSPKEAEASGLPVSEVRIPVMPLIIGGFILYALSNWFGQK